MKIRHLAIAGTSILLSLTLFVSVANAPFLVNPPISTAPSYGGFGITFDSDNLDIYVANTSTKDVSVICGSTSAAVCGAPLYGLVTNIALPTCGNPAGPDYRPSAIAYDSHNHKIYVACYDAGGTQAGIVEVICGSSNPLICGPANTVVCPAITLRPQDKVLGIAFDPNTNNLYLSTGSVWVDVISDTGCPGPITWNACTAGQNNCFIDLSTVCCGGVTAGIAYDQHNHDIYVTSCCTGGSNAYAINDNTYAVATICLVGTVPGCLVPVSTIPSGVAVDTDTHEVYITDSTANRVYYFSDSNPPFALKVTDSTGQLSAPNQVAYDSSNHRVYVTNVNANTVSVIFPDNSHKVMGNPCGPVPVGSYPIGLVFDPDNFDMVVANHLAPATAAVTAFHNTGPACTYPP